MEHSLTPATGLGNLASRAPRAALRNHLGELRKALTEGWEIVQPIFARPQWSSLDDRATAFHFVLERERATRLLTVPESRTVMRFIRKRSLTISG